MNRTKPVNLMAKIPNLPPRYIFAWQRMQDGSAVLTSFRSTVAEVPNIQNIAILHDRIAVMKDDKVIHRKLFSRVHYNFMEHISIVMEWLQRDLKIAEVVHVLYEPETPAFKLFHQKGKTWEEHNFPPPDYNSESYHFEYFIMESTQNIVVEVSAIMNTSAEIAASLGHGFLNYMDIKKAPSF